ncbi:MAG: hypothetical protein AAGH42_12605 [Pseudomonadota bacterium]
MARGSNQSLLRLSVFRHPVMIGVLAMLGASIGVPAQAQGWDPRAAKTQKSKLIRKSNEAIRTFRENDASLEAFFREAYGYAVFPSVTKGGAGIGAARGKGILYRGGVPTRKVYLSQYTVGLQFGGKKYREIIFFRDADGYNAFLDDEFEFSAQAAATIAASGAGETASYDEGVAVFVLDKAGAMVEASIGGQKFKIKPLK